MKNQDILLWVGGAVLLVALLWYSWPSIRRSREGFQTMGAIDQIPDVPATAESCALMRAMREQAVAKYDLALKESNQQVADLVKISLDSIEEQLKKINC